MEETVAILVVSGGIPVITECKEIRVLCAGEIVGRKNAINERKADDLFAISTPRAAGVIPKVATGTQL